MPPILKRQIVLCPREYPEELDGALVERAIDLRCISPYEGPKMLRTLGEARRSQGNRDLNDEVDIPCPGTVPADDLGKVYDKVYRSNSRQRSSLAPNEWVFTKVKPQDLLSYNDG